MGVSFLALMPRHGDGYEFMKTIIHRQLQRMVVAIVHGDGFKEVCDGFKASNLSFIVNS